MNKYLIKFATWLWFRCPTKSLKTLTWKVFLKTVRNKSGVYKINGLVFDLDLNEIIDLSIYLHRFEKDVSDFNRMVTKPGMTVIDVGANIGAHCLYFASYVGALGQVFAFEPTNYAFSKLLKNIKLNNSLNIKP